MSTVASSVMLAVAGITFPVRVVTAVASRDAKGVSLSTLCAAGHPPTKINSVYRCPCCGNEDKNSFCKGRENPDKTFSIIDPGALAQVKADTVPVTLKAQIALSVFPAEQVDTTTIPSADTPYHLEPPPKGDMGHYHLLASLVQSRPDLAFMGAWASREQPKMYRLRAQGERLMLHPVAWPADVEKPVATVVPSQPEHLEVFASVLDRFVTDFDPSDWVDARSVQIARVAEAAEQVAAGEATVAVESTAAQMDPLMAALNALVAA